MIVGNGRALPASSIPLGLTAMLAVTSTVAIIKASELLFSALDSGAGVALLLLACLAQWALLDGAWASLALALCVAVGGPVAEEPFLYSGCWHYLQPDYFLSVWNKHGRASTTSPARATLPSQPMLSPSDVGCHPSI